MPYSNGSLRPWAASVLGSLNIKSVVDVGSGAGDNLNFFKSIFPGAHWTAIEVWQPYVTKFDLYTRYDAVIEADARTLEPWPKSDLCIFGDVLEHMTKPEAIELWQKAVQVSKNLLISIPIIHYPQGAEFGNPFEEHKHHWTVGEVLSSFEGITDYSAGDVVGAFIVRDADGS